MCFHSLKQGNWGRLRNVGLAVAALLIGVAGAASRVRADGVDDVRTEKPERATPARSPIAVADDVIDPNQAINSDFKINVMVVGETEPSGDYKVDALGNINIRYAGAVRPVTVKGMTPTEAQDAIVAFLKEYIKNPVVKVTIMDMPKISVFIGGAVRLPGPVIINSDTTLLDVITRADYTDASDPSQVMIVRKDQSAPMYVNFEKFIRSRRGEKVDESLNPLLKDKDRIWIASRNVPGAVGTVSVFGEVTRPTPAVPLRTTAPMTVREVINFAGGALPTADRHRVSIRRSGIDRPLIIDLDRAETGDLINNIELKADDIVYVEKLESNAYITINGGFVKPANKIVYDKRMTLTQAIEEVGGLRPTPRQKRVRSCAIRSRSLAAQ